ncbi:hypothetical protein [Cerasicoccus frondis]|uniref:hypothetical protein n=1 Tax=Cerasicoccus frondis TaxID=490090 RepID=UPI0028524AEF|nr:hypothetical protein [Cerasicoccus frondis]
MQKFRLVIVILGLVAVFAANGLHLPIIQGAAWVKMYQGYSEVMPSYQALEYTMKSENMCGVCSWVQDHNPASEKDDLNSSDTAQTQPLIWLFMATIQIIAPEQRTYFHLFDGVTADQLPASAPILPP